ncbi:MAG: ribosome biogenesis GTPase Der [Myxococcota bacterium]
MSAPIVAIVGRPNVGKSTLFNRLVGQMRSIVADEPGVTRDRIYADAVIAGEHEDYAVVLVDTGGLDPGAEDPIMSRVLDQGQLAIDEADVVVLVADGRAGLVSDDRELAKRLRKAEKPTILAVNKLDGSEHEALAADFYRLGMEPTLAISAAHGRSIRDLTEAIVKLLPAGTRPEPAPPPEPPRRRGKKAKQQLEEEMAAAEEALEEPPEETTEEAEEARPAGPIRVAVVGRPNVGKSSLINRLLGEDRHLVSEVAGTTRDSVDSLIERNGKQYLFIDTAGIRRKRSIALRLEQFSVVAALKGLDRSDVALLLLDPTQGIAEQDAKVAAFAFEKGKAVVLVVSKWDQRQSESNAKEATTWVHEELPHLSYAPVVITSSHTGFGLDRLFAAIDRVAEEQGRRVSTGELNRFLEHLMKTHPPQSKKGKRGRIYYLRQIGSYPPRFLASVNDPELIHFSYRRYLINELRERYGFSGVPLLVGYRGRGK